jgi:hypothetical protein
VCLFDPSATRFPPVDSRRRAAPAEARRRLAVPVTGLGRLHTVAGPQLRVLGGGGARPWRAAGGAQRRRQPPPGCREGCCAATPAKSPELSCTSLLAEHVDGDAIVGLEICTVQLQCCIVVEQESTNPRPPLQGPPAGRGPCIVWRVWRPAACCRSCGGCLPCQRRPCASPSTIDNPLSAAQRRTAQGRRACKQTVAQHGRHCRPHLHRPQLCASGTSWPWRPCGG